jgi:transposase-like protein
MRGRPRSLTELQRLVVIEAYASRDASVRELAAVYGMCTFAIYTTYLRHHVRPYGGLDEDLVRAMRKRGAPIAKIAHECGVHKSTVERFLVKAGLTQQGKL